MHKLFSYDNKFFTFMGKIADLMILNLLCIICCFPIITAGASVTALYYVSMKIVRNEDSSIIKLFFHAFRNNLKQSTIIYLVLLCIGSVITLNYFFINQISAEFYFLDLVRCILLIASFLFFAVVTYIFPILAQFYNTVKNTFRNALLMSIRHILCTLVLLLITIIPFVLMLINEYLFSYLMLYYLLMGFGVMAYLHSLIFVKIFSKYITV